MSEQDSFPSDRITLVTRFIKELGVPVAMLAILSFGGYQAISWVGENLLGPLVQDQRDNNRELNTSLKSLTGSMEKLADETVKHSQRLDSIAEDVKQIRNGNK